jgi:hypothetical protein
VGICGVYMYSSPYCINFCEFTCHYRIHAPILPISVSYVGSNAMVSDELFTRKKKVIKGIFEKLESLGAEVTGVAE